MSRAVPSSPAKFFALVLGLSVPFYLLGAVGPDLTRRLPVQLPISALMVVCPAVAALWLTRREQGPPGVRALLWRTVDLRRVRDGRWWLPTALLMPAVLLLSSVVQQRLGQRLPPASISLPIVAGEFVVFLVAAVSEELGWTGYATGPLEARYGALRGALLLGTFWALWHVIPDLQAHRSGGWVFWHAVGTVALRVLMVWLYTHAGRSLFTVTVLHATGNVAEFTFPRWGSHYDPRVTGLILVGAAVLVTWRWGAGPRKRARA